MNYTAPIKHISMLNIETLRKRYRFDESIQEDKRNMKDKAQKSTG